MHALGWMLQAGAWECAAASQADAAREFREGPQPGGSQPDEAPVCGMPAARLARSGARNDGNVVETGG